MKKPSLVRFSVENPKTVFAIAIILTIAFLTQFPKIRIDTNPKNMLPPDSSVRVWNDEVDAVFGLYTDMIAVGVTNDGGVLNTRTLGKVTRITEAALGIKGVAGRDVNAIPTITNVTAEAGGLRVAPLMPKVPENEAEVGALKKQLFGNPMFVDRIISKDGRTTAIYLPLEKGANGKEVADKLKLITAKEGGPENYYIAGDPVARDTFGAEMFKLMGVFSPMAGFIMFIAIYLMFRSVFLAASMMAVAMISIVWSMGLLIGLGFPVHIMSSMAPVFLMAIATDSIHIFNEFFFRIRENKDKKTAILETMAAVSRPVRYTALATAAGFGVLLFMSIIPVQVFGGVIAFGTIVLRLLSFSLIPALLTLVNTDKAAKSAVAQGASAKGNLLGRLASIGVNRPVAAVVVSAAVVIVSIIGVAKITVNNNMVEWFKKGSEIRTADEVMNKNLGGTSLGYVIAEAGEEGAIKTPQAMRYIEGLQRHLERLPAVGKTSSIADVVKRINYVLHDEGKEYDAIPDNKEEIGQYLFLFGMSAKPSDMDSLVNYPFTKANVWVQLKTWDVQAMRDVVKATADYQKANANVLALRPAGNAYFNLVWNDSVLWDMLKGFLLALVIVFIILALDFRSLKWAIVGYIPLLFTILLLYGIVGYMGKDFDMPISVLSCLSLGMAVDFAIHFVSRLRQRLAEGNGGGEVAPESLKDALLWTAMRPGKGIVKNAILFAGAFSVMLFAPLTPYITVGAFIVSMMVLSSVFTLVLLPALILTFEGWLFKGSP